MSYKIKATQRFEKELKRLLKKYPSLKSEYAQLIQLLEKDNNYGTPIGNNCYKIRLAIASKGKGKSGGARIITFLIHADKELYLISIYDKSEKENILPKELHQAILAARESQ